jgi:hypothetical protein
MPNRRKVLLGIGSLAAGSAAAMGTGAFTSASANRELTVSTASDSDAYLTLESLDTPNSNEFVSETGGRSDTLAITIDQSEQGGEGVNEQAEMYFDDLFRVKNQGTQPVWFWMESGTQGVGFYKGDQEVSISTDGHNIEPRPTIQYLEVGDSIDVGLSINTVGTPFDRDAMATARAEANESDVPGGNDKSVENSDKGV